MKFITGGVKHSPEKRYKFHQRKGEKNPPEEGEGVKDLQRFGFLGFSLVCSKLLFAFRQTDFIVHKQSHKKSFFSFFIKIFFSLLQWKKMKIERHLVHETRLLF